ncbi:MAG: aminotransferase class V-fold PLP-dependent enzyme [Alphaproteobacteria bacterium]|nr:aminotransferase class V-fold PLP-dependent enzyme [Alphaproteobacteria bacterium]
MNDRSAPPPNVDPYRALGVRPFINCCSVRTLHGGSLMLPQVRAAMDAASRQYVNLDELMAAANRRIAELTGAEAGIVTCGSAAAVALATAACVAGNDPVRMLRLPHTEGWTNRVVMPRNQRFAYDQAIRMVGTVIIEVDTLAEFEAAIQEPTAMICVLGTHEAMASFRLEDMVGLARLRGIPVLVDAASEHIERPSPWLVRGADMVIYSGGKFLRGPQTSGLLLGRKDLVEAAWRNASPHQALGRPMKVSKEDVVGLIAALEYWFEQRDPAVELKRWRGALAEIAARLGPDVATEVIEPSGVVMVPRLRVRWDAARFGIDGEGVRLALLEREPRVMLDDTATTANSLEIDPFGIQPGEAVEVGRAIAAVLASHAKAAAAPSTAAAETDVSGEWDVVVNFVHGPRKHRLRLNQAGGTLTGEQSSEQFEGAVTGNLNARSVSLNFVTRLEGNTVSYRLDGDVAGGRMSGTATLGSVTDHHKGPFGRGQFGTAAWQAVRSA